MFFHVCTFPLLAFSESVVVLFNVINWCTQIKCGVNEVSIDKRRRIASTKMLPITVPRTTTRQALSVVNGGQDLQSGPPSNSGSDCSAIEFSKDGIEALLNEKLKKNLGFRVR